MWFLSFWRPPFYLRSVILNLKSGEAITGVLWHSRGPWLTLKDASLLTAGKKPTPMDGEVVVHRDNLNFAQVLP